MRLSVGNPLVYYGLYIVTTLCGIFGYEGR